MTRRHLAWFFVGTACLLLLVEAGQVTSSDGNSSLQLTRSMVDDTSITVPADAGVRGRDGTIVSKYGVGLPLVAVVPYVLAKPVAAVLGHDREVESFALASLMALIVAALAVAVAVLGLRLGGSPFTALLVAGGTVFGTYLMTYAKEFYSEPLVALAVVLSLLALSARRLEWAAVAIGWACLTRPQSLLLVPVFLAIVWAVDRRRVVRVLGVLAAFVAVMCAYNYLRYGDALQFSYPGEGFDGNVLDAARGFVGDSDKSVFLFTPCVVLLPWALWALWSRHRAVTALMTANVLLVLGTSVFWHDWEGGWSWGPRLLLAGIVPALPAFAPWLRGVRWRVWAFVACCAVGFLVSFPTLLVPTQAQELDHVRGQTSPSIVRQYELIGPTARYSADHLTQRSEAGTGSHRKYLSLWQLNAARVLGNKGFAAAVVVSVGLAAVAAFALRRTSTRSSLASRARA